MLNALSAGKFLKWCLTFYSSFCSRLVLLFTICQTFESSYFIPSQRSLIVSDFSIGS